MTRLTPLALVATLMACSVSAHTPPRTEPTSADLAAARAEILPLFEQMKAAAQAHDVDAHLAFYVHSPTLLFVINGEAIRGWEALRQKQREWWQNGTSDVVYRLVDSVDYRMAAPGLVVQTYFLASRRTAAGGSTRESRLGVTALWQKRAEGWRIIYAHESSATR